MRYRVDPSIAMEIAKRFPFRRDNRKPDGTWDAPDATDDNIKGTSVDPYDAVWPLWKRTPPPDGEGEFVSDEPFFDIDEITQRVELYPPGRPLIDRNVDGNPASRQRVRDILAGNHWRRRVLVGPVGADATLGDRSGMLQHVGAAPAPALPPPQPDPLYRRQPMPDEPEFWAVRPPRGGDGVWASRFPFYLVNGQTNRVVPPIWQSDVGFPSPDVYPPARNGQPAGDGVPDLYQRGSPINRSNDYLWPYLGL